MDLINEFIKTGDSLVLSNLEKNLYELNRFDKEYWNFLILNSNLKEELIIDNLDYINIELLIKNQNLTSKILLEEDFWNKIYELKLFNLIIKYQNLNIDILNKIIDLNSDLDWDILCQYQNLTIDIMEKYKEKINWNIISENQFMTIEFIIANKDLINWEELGTNSKIQFLLNETFLELFKDYNLWAALIWSKNITNEYVIDNLDKLSKDQILELLEVRKLSEENIKDIIIKYGDIDGIYSAILEGQNISLEFINENFDKLNFDDIITNQNINYDFIIKFKDINCLKKLSYNDNLDEELILKIYENINEFKDEFDWDYISEYIDLSESTIKIIKELNMSKLIEKKINSY